MTQDDARGVEPSSPLRNRNDGRREAALSFRRRTGTTITERHDGAALKMSCETITTGQRPLCSEPDRGFNGAQ
jgi:hypothetical protein